MDIDVDAENDISGLESVRRRGGGREKGSSRVHATHGATICILPV